jgi:hypothetical protein
MSADSMVVPMDGLMAVLKVD